MTVTVLLILFQRIRKPFGIKISENYYAVPVFTNDQAKAGIPIECFGVVDAENQRITPP